MDETNHNAIAVGSIHDDCIAISDVAGPSEQTITELDQRLDAEGAPAYRLADLRRRQELTQNQVATVMGVRQPRVSQLEGADLSHVEVATLRTYVDALGGTLRVIVEFGDEHLTLAN